VRRHIVDACQSFGGNDAIMELALVEPQEDSYYASEAVQKEEADKNGTSRFGFITVATQAAYDHLLKNHKILKGGIKPSSKKLYRMYLRPSIDKSSPDSGICYLWKEFRCPYGDECKFQHTGPGDIKLKPEKSERKKKQKCFQYKKTGKCSRGDACPYVHNDANDVRQCTEATTPEKTKTTTKPKSEKDCISWKTKGKCKKGETCPYRHDEELQKKALQKKALQKKMKRKQQQTDNDNQQQSKNNDTRKRSKKEKQPLSVRVFGMNYDTVEQDIHDFFRDCGPIVEITFPTFEDSGRSKGYCGVLFQSPKAVQKAIEMDGMELMGRWLSIQAGKMYLKQWDEYHNQHQGGSGGAGGDAAGVSNADDTGGW